MRSAVTALFLGSDRGQPLRFTITRWADYEEVGSVLEKGIQEKGVFVLLRATAPFV